MHKKNKARDSQVGIFHHLTQWAGEHLWFITIALFILSFVIRLYYNFWSGPVVTQVAYPDEIRFFHIACSLAEQGQILVRSLPTTYQKILYPLMISPAFLLSDDQITQMNIIRVINCILVSSTVFPVHLLAKKLTSNKIVIILSLLVTLTLPDMAYSATFSAEILNMPLVIWLFYIACFALSEQVKSKRAVFFVILGFVMYLVYLTKESGATFLVAAVLILIIDAVRCKQHLKENALCVLAMAAAFFIPFILMKLTIFHGMGNTYATDTHNQITLSVLTSPYVFFYLFYSFIVFFMAAVLTFYVAPVFFTLYSYSAMNEENRKIYLFTMLSFLIMIGAIAYTIYIREDLGALVPRLHMRYITPFVIPLLIQCLNFLFSEAEIKPNKFFSKVFSVIIMVFCFALIILLPHAPEEDAFYDHFSLRSTHSIELLTIHVGAIPVNMLLMLFKLLLMVLTVYGAFLIVKKKKKKPVIIMLLLVVFTVNIYDNFMDYTSIRRAKTSDFSPVTVDPSPTYLKYAFCEEGLRNSYDTIDSLIATNNYLKKQSGTMIVFTHSTFSSYTDTYLTSNTFPVDPFDLWHTAIQNGGWVRIDAQPIWVGNRYRSRFLGLDTWMAGVVSVDYIITLVGEHPFLNVEIEYEKWPFVVLRNLDPDIVYIELE